MSITQPKDWENPQLVASNRFPAHSSGMPYPDVATASSRDPQRSPWVANLDGAGRNSTGAQPELPAR